MFLKSVTAANFCFPVSGGVNALGYSRIEFRSWMLDSDLAILQWNGPIVLKIEGFDKFYTKDDAEKLIERFTQEIKEFAKECLEDGDYSDSVYVDFTIGADKIKSAFSLAWLECGFKPLQNFHFTKETE